jgi:SAM-dependent methyltransferase
LKGDPRALLALPAVYSLFRWLVGRDKARTAYAREHLRAHAGERVLDIGCGTADILEVLPPVHYVGYDPSADYIERARRRFPQAEFHCGAVVETLPLAAASFDLVIAHGVLHHLDDAAARMLFRIARRVLKRGARLVTYDGCFTDDQSAAARWLLWLDRGQHVRTRAAYEALARAEFAEVRSFVRHDLLRMPYTHIIMECSA